MLMAVLRWLLRRLFGIDTADTIDFDGLNASISETARAMGL